MKKIKVTQEEWDKIADDFAKEQAGKTASLSVALERIVHYMSVYRVVKKN